MIFSLALLSMSVSAGCSASGNPNSKPNPLECVTTNARNLQKKRDTPQFPNRTSTQIDKRETERLVFYDFSKTDGAGKYLCLDGVSRGRWQFIRYCGPPQTVEQFNARFIRENTYSLQEVFIIL
jgi:hypothetical protein